MSKNNPYGALPSDLTRSRSSKENNARIAASKAKAGIGSKPASIPEIDRAPKASAKGSCKRKRAGQPQSAKVVRANAQRELEAARRAAKTVILSAKADSHKAYVEAQDRAQAKIDAEVAAMQAKIDAEDAATLEAVKITTAALSLNSVEGESEVQP